MNQTKHRFEDGDDRQDEKLSEEAADLVARITKQFRRLQLKAHDLGIHSVVVLHTYDPLAGCSTHDSQRQGDIFANLGGRLGWCAKSMRTLRTGTGDTRPGL